MSWFNWGNSKAPAQSNSASGQGASGGRVTVYTDGSCLANGTARATCGVGVHLDGPKSCDYSGKLSKSVPQNISEAEIGAAIKGVRVAKERGYNNFQVKTDSSLVVDGMNKWRNNDYKGASGKQVANASSLRQLEKAVGKSNVTFSHVKGHSGQQGNVSADKLARKGAKR